MDVEKEVRSDKLLAHIERAFRSFKTVDLKVHPIHHTTQPMVQARGSSEG